MVEDSHLDLELSEAEMLLYSRQILLQDWDIEAQERLKLANVLIVGCGGIGCTTAELLARAGVGQISLIDADTVEISNLQRQIGFSQHDVGYYKSEVLAKRLKQINPYIQIEFYTEQLSVANIQHLMASQDLVLDGCDNFETRYLVNAYCKQLNVPLISGSAIGMEGQLFMVEGDSACYQCLFPIEDTQDQALRCADTGVLATTPNVIASLQAHHALLYLGLNRTPLLEKLLMWNGLTMQQRILSFAKESNCPICRARASANAF